MKQVSDELALSTRGRSFTMITGEVQAWLASTGLEEGLLTLLVQHTSASLLIQENADPSVRRDFEKIFARLIPDGDPAYEHTLEGDDDMAAHIRSALTATSLSIPFSSGRLCLGTWQGIYLWEHRTHPHRRRIHLHVIGE